MLKCKILLLPYLAAAFLCFNKTKVVADIVTHDDDYEISNTNDEFEFRVGENDETDFGSGWDTAIFEYLKTDFPDEAGELEYVGTVGLSWSYVGFTKMNFEPKNGWWGTLEFKYRIVYLGSTCDFNQFCYTNWSKVKITVTNDDTPTPISDSYDITYSVFQYAETYWPMLNDICSYDGDNTESAPCNFASMLLDPDDEDLNVQYGDAGGYIVRWDTANQWQLGPNYIKYHPNIDTFRGQECFQYWIKEQNFDDSTSANICFNMEDMSHLSPTANDDLSGYTTTTADTITIDILENDSYVSLDSLSVTFSIPDAVYNNDGTITYTPPAGQFAGTVTFTYTITDEWGSSTATVSIDLTEPIYSQGVDDTVTLSSGETLTFNYGLNDYNPLIDNVSKKWSGESMQTHWSLGCLKKLPSWSDSSTEVTLVAEDVTETKLCEIYYTYKDDVRTAITITVNPKTIPSTTWNRIHAAAKMSQEIYYDDSFDPSRQGLSIVDSDKFTYEVTTHNGESAVVAYMKGDDDYCMAAFRGDAINESSEDIRDSDFGKRVYNPHGACNDINTELLSGFSDVKTDVVINIKDCLDTCKNDNGHECDLHLTGHNKGGVWAQIMGAMMSYYLAETYAGGDDSYEPYIVTFGSPPAFHKDSASCDLLPSDDHMFSFVNLKEVWGDMTVMDPAVAIGLDVNAAHPENGYLVVLNGDSNNVYVSSSPNNDSEYDDPEESYDLQYTEKDTAKLYAHSIEMYTDRIDAIVSSGAYPTEGGFDLDDSCLFDNHCMSGYQCGHTCATDLVV